MITAPMLIIIILVIMKLIYEIDLCYYEIVRLHWQYLKKKGDSLSQTGEFVGGESDGF